MTGAVGADELGDLVRSYVALSKGMRFEAKKAYWDIAEPRPLLKPEEAQAPLIGWPAIEAYWSATRSSLKSLESRCFDISGEAVEAELALVQFSLAWKADIDGPFLSGPPLGALVRVTGFLRQAQGGWKFFAYVEGHVDATAFAEMMYRAELTDG